MMSVGYSMYVISAPTTRPVYCSVLSSHSRSFNVSPTLKTRSFFLISNGFDLLSRPSKYRGHVLSSCCIGLLLYVRPGIGRLGFGELRDQRDRALVQVLDPVLVLHRRRPIIHELILKHRVAQHIKVGDRLRHVMDRDRRERIVILA